MAAQELQSILRTLEAAVTQSGKTLPELSRTSPVLLVFLRHAGCPFCREALSDLARSRFAIESTGARIVLVNMGDSKALEKQLRRYGLAGMDLISDPGRKLYKALGLRRGSLWQLFGPKAVWRFFCGGVFAGHGMGWISADLFQMPGLFLLDRARIVRSFRHRCAADRPDYAGICATALKTRA